MEFADIFGYAGTITGMSFMIPQVWKSWRTKSVEDVSWAMLLILFTNSILWVTYGALIGRMPLVLSNSVTFVVVITLMSLKHHYRKP